MRKSNPPILILMVLLFLPGFVSGEEGDVLVFSLRGEVVLEVEGAERPLRAGETLAAGSVVRTGAGGRVTLIFSDNSQLTLGPERTVRIGGESRNRKGGKGLQELWRRITGKRDDAEYSSSFGTVGAVRGEEDLPLEDWPLYEEELEELQLELEAVGEQFTDPGTRSFLSAIILEEYEQYETAGVEYERALELLPPGGFLYDAAIDFYLKAEQYEKAESLAERKEALAGTE